MFVLVVDHIDMKMFVLVALMNLIVLVVDQIDTKMFVLVVLMNLIVLVDIFVD